MFRSIEKHMYLWCHCSQMLPLPTCSHVLLSLQSKNSVWKGKKGKDVSKYCANKLSFTFTLSHYISTWESFTNVSFENGISTNPRLRDKSVDYVWKKTCYIPLLRAFQVNINHVSNMRQGLAKGILRLVTLYFWPCNHFNKYMGQAGWGQLQVFFPAWDQRFSTWKRTFRTKLICNEILAECKWFDCRVRDYL